MYETPLWNTFLPPTATATGISARSGENLHVYLVCARNLREDDLGSKELTQTRRDVFNDANGAQLAAKPLVLLIVRVLRGRFIRSSTADNAKSHLTRKLKTFDFATANSYLPRLLFALSLSLSFSPFLTEPGEWNAPGKKGRCTHYPTFERN